jgi:tripartite ATP-independent transporter DctP family solute receptor
MRRTIALSGLALLLFLTGCGRQQDLVILKLGHGLDRTHSVHLAMEYMAERMAEKSDGTVRIDVYPSQQLGTERECLELLQIGSIAITKVSAAVLEGFVPEFKVFNLPFVFRDSEHFFQVLEGPLGKRMLLATQRYRLRGLCYYDSGSRSFYTKARPIRQPSDLAGLKIRTQESSTAIRMVQALGGSATPIAWGELYTALQQGVVDGAENNPPSFFMSRHYEVCKYYSLNEHTSVPDVVLISTTVWDSLSPEVQEWLQEAADESAQYQKGLWKESSDESLRLVREAGVEIIYPDKGPFVEKVQPLLAEYKNEPLVYQMLEEIRMMGLSE